jgi:hypothetical protein
LCRSACWNQTSDGRTSFGSPRSQDGKSKRYFPHLRHRKIHATLSARDPDDFNTWNVLSHPDIAPLLALANKPPTFYDNSRKPANPP